MNEVPPSHGTASLKGSLREDETAEPGYSEFIPPELYAAVAASGGGRLVLVTGAGCSMESPTGLRSGAEYSEAAYDNLVDDGVLPAGSCDEPRDLSKLADVVFESTGSQAALTQRLPRSAWRAATPNTGHFAAAALLIEGAFRAIVTLNYDAALQVALSMLGLPPAVSIAKGPEEHGAMSNRALIYLHRSAESPESTWILRKTDLDESWRQNWEDMVAGGILSAPMTLFAGLGSPAAVLTETVNRLATIGRTRYYLADPYPGNSFQAALQEHLDGVVKMGWSSLMTGLAMRLARAQSITIRASARNLAEERGLEKNLADTCALLLCEGGLERLGRLRSRWLLHDQLYAPDAKPRNTDNWLTCFCHFLVWQEQ